MEKLFSLIEELNIVITLELELKEKLLEEQKKKAQFENEIWLNTQFNVVLKGNNNDSTRKAYVSHKINTEFIDKTGALSNELHFVQQYIKYLSKKINIFLDVGPTDANQQEILQDILQNSPLMKLDSLSEASKDRIKDIVSSYDTVE